MRKFGLMLFVGILATCSLSKPAAAITQFHKEFVKLYVGEASDTELAKLVNDKEFSKQKCLVCHQGKKKKNRNAYGMAIGKFLDKKKDKKDVEKIIATLKKVSEMPSNPEDENSPTFGELIAAGKLPGGSLDDLMKEPEKEPETEEAGK